MAEIYDGMKEHGDKPQASRPSYEVFGAKKDKVECASKQDDGTDDIIVYSSDLGGWLTPKP